MMKVNGIAAAVAFGLAAAACGQGRAPALATLQDSASYAVGLSMGHQLQQVKDEVDIEQVVQGIRDVLQSDTSRLTPMEAQQVMQAYGQEVQQRQQQARAVAADSNKIAGEAYRAENAKREGVTTTASGLQYEVLTPSDGPKPGPTSVVKVHYKGTLIDGKEFDSSTSGEPVTFALNEVIPGWTEAIGLMSVGSKYRFVIPSDLAYGDRGSPPRIPGGATLIFQVELLKINGK